MWGAAGPITAVDHQMEGTTAAEMGNGVGSEAVALQTFVQTPMNLQLDSWSRVAEEAVEVTQAEHLVQVVTGVE